MTDFDTFIHDYADNTIFRYFKYRKVFTPYEMDKKFSDEDIYENGGYAKYVYIRQAIELPNGDILLKLEETIPPSDEDLYDGESDRRFLYEKLSDIVLQEWETDNRKWLMNNSIKRYQTDLERYKSLDIEVSHKY